MMDNEKIELKENIKRLNRYISAKLKIKNIPRVILSHNSKNSKETLGKTGYYDPKNKLIKIYITDRHPTDILRSYCHELIHHYQNENDKLNMSDDASSHSPSYAQDDENLRKCELEAYMLGNILFRDWRDEILYGSPDKDPFLMFLNENIIRNYGGI